MLLGGIWVDGITVVPVWSTRIQYKSERVSECLRKCSDIPVRADSSKLVQSVSINQIVSSSFRNYCGGRRFVLRHASLLTPESSHLAAIIELLSPGAILFRGSHSHELDPLSSLSETDRLSGVHSDSRTCTLCKISFWYRWNNDILR